MGEAEQVPTCRNGYPGYEGETDYIGALSCCALECGRCASEGCEDLPGGPDACCPAIIYEFGLYCSGGDAPEAPCFLNEKFYDGDDDYERELPAIYEKQLP